MILQKLPTVPTERIALIDVIRGFAVLGILFSNILIFSGFMFTPFKDLSLLGHAQLNGILHYMSNALVSGKFYPIFCMLFGYGFYMQVAKFNNNDKSFVGYFSRRLFFLLLIGIIHQLIWPGDVITIYALVGFLFLFVRKTNYKQDLFLAIAFFGIYLMVGFYHMIFPTANEAIKQTALLSLPGIDNYQLIEKIRSGGVLGMYYFYIPYYKVLWSVSRLSLTTQSVIGLFFMGGYLYKSDFFNKQALKTRNIIIFFVLGIVGSYLWFYVAYPFRIIDNLFWGLAYMSLLAVLFKTKLGKRILQNLIPVGRMALTCYVLQSVLCIFVFYGFGLGLFAQIPLFQVYLIAIAMLVIQVILCKLWLKKYQFGPLEWIWRSLSYKKIIPIKIQR